jgi:hypothetical protein
VRAAQRRRIERRQDDDRRMDERATAQRSDLLRKSGGLARGPRNQDARSAERTRGGSVGANALAIAFACEPVVNREPRCAAREEILGECGAERLRACRVGDFCRALAANDVGALAIGDQAAQPQFAAAAILRIAGDRRMATAGERSRKCAFSGGRQNARRIGKRLQRGDDVGAIGTAFEAERALPYRRQEFLGSRIAEIRCASSSRRRPAVASTIAS